MKNKKIMLLCMLSAGVIFLGFDVVRILGLMEQVRLVIDILLIVAFVLVIAFLSIGLIRRQK